MKVKTYLQCVKVKTNLKFVKVKRICRLWNWSRLSSQLSPDPGCRFRSLFSSKLSMSGSQVIWFLEWVIFIPIGFVQIYFWIFMNVGVEEVILVFDNQPVADSLLSEDICTFLQLQKLLGVGVLLENSRTNFNPPEWNDHIKYIISKIPAYMGLTDSRGQLKSNIRMSYFSFRSLCSTDGSILWK